MSDRIISVGGNEPAPKFSLDSIFGDAAHFAMDYFTLANATANLLLRRDAQFSCHTLIVFLLLFAIAGLIINTVLAVVNINFYNGIVSVHGSQLLLLVSVVVLDMANSVCVCSACLYVLTLANFTAARGAALMWNVNTGLTTGYLTHLAVPISEWLIVATCLMLCLVWYLCLQSRPALWSARTLTAFVGGLLLVAFFVALPDAFLREAIYSSGSANRSNDVVKHLAFSHSLLMIYIYILEILLRLGAFIGLLVLIGLYYYRDRPLAGSELFGNAVQLSLVKTCFLLVWLFFSILYLIVLLAAPGGTAVKTLGYLRLFFLTVDISFGNLAAFLAAGALLRRVLWSSLTCDTTSKDDDVSPVNTAAIPVQMLSSRQQPPPQQQRASAQSKDLAMLYRAQLHRELDQTDFD